MPVPLHCVAGIQVATDTGSGTLRLKLSRARESARLGGSVTVTLHSGCHRATVTVTGTVTADLNWKLPMVLVCTARSLNIMRATRG